MVIAPEHPLVEAMKDRITNIDAVYDYRAKAARKSDFERSELAKDKTGVPLEGITAINPATGAVEAVTIEEQTHQVCKNLKAVLEEAGSSLDKAVKTVCFLKNMSDFAAFNGIYGEYFTSKPARSCVAAKELPKDVLVEVEVIAEL